MIARLALLLLLATFVAACASRTTTPMPVTVGAEERGLASWYGHPYHGRRTASGEIYDMKAMTAAHRTMPFDTWLHVENLDTGQTTRVRVNDRGPFVDGRILDVSHAAGIELGVVARGVAPVRLRVVVPPAPAAPAFTVQVGAFRSETGAAALITTLTDAGFDAEIAQAVSNGQVLYRVRAGRFATRPDAEAHAARLARRGFAAIVVVADVPLSGTDAAPGSR